MCFKNIMKFAANEPLSKAAHKKGGWAASTMDVLHPGGAAAENVKNGAPLTFRTTLDPNNWTGINPSKPLEDMSAEEQEAARQARISANVTAINKAYSGREQQYTDFANALRTKYNTDLTRQYNNANRNLKFALAGSGLTGGSYAADSGKELGREQAEGAVTSEQKVGEAESGLRSQDENARLQLIGLAQAGGDIGNPETQSANMLKANLQNAQGSTAGTLGDVFGSTAATYKALQSARNLRRGLTGSYEQIYGSGIGVPQVTPR